MRHTFDAIHKAISNHGHNDTRALQSESRAVLRLNQSTEAQRNKHLKIGKGVCQGLVIEWLASKRDGKAFVSTDAAVDRLSSANKGTAVNAASKHLESAIKTQASYENNGLPAGFEEHGFKGRSQPLSTWMRSSPRGKLAWGDATSIIATAEFNCFNIEIQGEEIQYDEKTDTMSLDPKTGKPVWIPYGHAMGAFRPNVPTSFISGKSKNFSLFDPNVGEFFVDIDTMDIALDLLLENYVDPSTTLDSVVLVGIK